MNQLELAADGLDRVALLAARDEHLENVVSVTSAVLEGSALASVMKSFDAPTYLAVASNLKVFDCDRSLLVVSMKISSCLQMLQPNQVAVPHNRDVLLAERFAVVWFDDPPVVFIFVGVGGDLLLTGADSFRVQMEVRVEIAAAGFVILQGDD